MVEKSNKKISDKPEKTIKDTVKTKNKDTSESAISDTSPKIEIVEKNTLPINNTVTLKTQKPKKKRISKGLATHNRRAKQEKRHPSNTTK
jgi:hypothetical protein